MATYNKISRSIPLNQRVILITDVSVGDTIDIVDALGRPAKRIQFNMTDPTDQIEYRINTLRWIRSPKLSVENGGQYTVAESAFGVEGTTLSAVWSGTGDTLSDVGESILTAEGISISSVVIDSLTVSVGSTITITAW